MIFVTVGHQMPFDRLIKLVDTWAERRGRRDLFAQVGEGRYRPRNFPCAPFLSDAQFSNMISQCTAVIAHAGTGSIISALSAGKPMLVLPRRSHLEETRNDHQVATAAHFASSHQVLMGKDDDDFVDKLDAVHSFRPRSLVGSSASQKLLFVIKQFIDSELAAGEIFAFEDEQQDPQSS